LLYCEIFKGRKSFTNQIFFIHREFESLTTYLFAFMQMVAADWLRSDRREDDLGGRPGSIMQVDFGVLVLNFDYI
jgi:DNA-directed RNA polymerase specialized sigma24 family protein